MDRKVSDLDFIFVGAGCLRAVVEHDVAERAGGRDPGRSRRDGLAGPLVVDTDQLTLPHPRLADRRFVLAPLAEIAADVQVPAPFHESVGYLLDMCPDTSDIRRTSHSLQLPRSA